MVNLSITQLIVDLWNNSIVPVFKLVTGLYSILPAWLATVIYSSAATVAVIAIKRILF